MAGKYMPLEYYLRTLPPNQREVSLTFEQIEKILNDKLPSSAYKDERCKHCVLQCESTKRMATMSQAGVVACLVFFAGTQDGR